MCSHARAYACACISFKVGLVEVQNGGNQDFIAATQSFQYKEMPVWSLWWGVPVTLKFSKYQSRPRKEIDTFKFET